MFSRVLVIKAYRATFSSLDRVASVSGVPFGSCRYYKCGREVKNKRRFFLNTDIKFP